MGLFKDIMSNKSFDSLIKKCEKRNLCIGENIVDDTYRATIMHKENKDISLNIELTESKFSAFVFSSNKNDEADILESLEVDITSDDDINKSVDDSINTFDVIKDIDPDDILTENEEDDNDTDIISGLNSIKDNLKASADKLKNLSDLSDNVEIISIIMDLSNNAYSLILDIDSAIESYNEILEIPEDEEDIDDKESSVEESKARINVANAMMSVNTACKLGVISESKCNNFIKACKNLF